MEQPKCFNEDARSSDSDICCYCTKELPVNAAFSNDCTEDVICCDFCKYKFCRTCGDLYCDWLIMENTLYGKRVCNLCANAYDGNRNFESKNNN
jgi:hypothetical protein